MFSALDVIADACAVIGEEPPAALTGDVQNGDECSRVYRNVVGFMLGTYPFSFGVRPFLLAEVEAAPVGFAHAYQMPAERLGPPVRLTDRIDDADAAAPFHTISGSEIWCDAAPLWAFFKVVPDPSSWSATFRQTAITAIAAELALSLASDRNTYAVLREAAYGPPSALFRGGYMASAIAEDARATPPRKLPSANPLIAARYR